MNKLSTEFYTVTEDTIFIAYAKKGLVKITYDPLKPRDKSYLVTGVNFQDAKNSIAIILREPDFVKLKMFAEGYINDPTGKSFEGQYGAQIVFSKYNNEIKTFSMKAGVDNNPNNKLEMTVLLNLKQGNNTVSIPIDYYTLVSMIYMADNALNNRYETTNSILKSMARLTESVPNNIGFNIFNAMEQRIQASKNYNMDNNNQMQNSFDNNQMNNQFGNQQTSFPNQNNNQQSNPFNNQQNTFNNQQTNQQNNPFNNQKENLFSGQPTGNTSNVFQSGNPFNKASFPSFNSGNSNSLTPDLNG